MPYYFANPAPACGSCAECGFLADCGGLDGADAERGCFQRCEERCRESICDCICPCASSGFEDAWEEVGGICVPPQECNGPAQDRLALYIPQIHHGSRRHADLDEPWVSVPLSAITRRKNRKLEIRFDSREDLCRGMRLRLDAKIILSCVAPDPLIEQFWQFHKSRSLLDRIATLGFVAATVPNYSFMLDVPRTNSLWNLSRIFRMAERMSQVGIPTVPHINASTRADWEKWTDLLGALDHIKYVAMEFQTGLRKDQRVDVFLQRFEEMMSRLGRPLHPIVVGGSGRLRTLSDLCPSVTVIDSTPFMKAMKRQLLTPRADGRRPRWETVRTKLDTCLGSRLAQNVRLHRNLIHLRIGRDDAGEQVQPGLLAAV